MGVLFSRDKATTGIAAMLLRLANLPVRQVFSLAPRRASPKRTRYSGEQLRKIMAEKGVGRGARGGKWHKVGGYHGVAGYKVYGALIDSIYLDFLRGDATKNYAEWQRKPRPKDRSAA